MAIGLDDLDPSVAAAFRACMDDPGPSHLSPTSASTAKKMALETAGNAVVDGLGDLAGVVSAARTHTRVALSVDQKRFSSTLRNRRWRRAKGWTWTAIAGAFATVMVGS